ncbi:porin family protein [Segetibacter koreensis]|uniref:porin family protein n=1 Tax=Segetibacter koreensis TaxID=398037 RepID=UPI0003775C97|nr:porin family protein [Segetibacter koreensis]
MKKLLLAVIICSSFCFTAMAQSKFSLGPNAGFGHTWVSNSNNAKFKLAANAGVAMVYSATEHFGIGLDAKYSYEGVKTGSGAANALDLNYFRFPLKAIYFFNNYGNQFRPKIFAGPSFGFLSSAKTNGVNVKSLYNSSDVGITAGAGFNYRLVKNSWFTADINYLHGLSDVTKDASIKNHNRNLQLNVGVNFGL